MNHNPQIPLLQEGKNGWADPQPNPALLKSRRSPQSGQGMTTKDIQRLTRLPKGKLPPVGAWLCWQSYILLHQTRNRWLIYEQVST